MDLRRFQRLLEKEEISTIASEVEEDRRAAEEPVGLGEVTMSIPASEAQTQPAAAVSGDDGKENQIPATGQSSEINFFSLSLPISEGTKNNGRT